MYKNCCESGMRVFRNGAVFQKRGYCFMSLERLGEEEKLAEKWNTFNSEMNTNSGDDMRN